MPQNLIIIGAGGFGREVFEWAEQTWGFEGGWRFRGFLDDDPDALRRFDHPGRIIGNISSYRPQPEDFFLCALGKPALKEKLTRPLLEKGAQFTTLIHPTAVVGRRVAIGEGCILCPRVVLTCDIEIGRFVSFNIATAVGHDATVGDWTQTSSFCDLTGYTHCGARVFMGSRASLLPGVKVGDGAVVGAGSVVVRNVAPGQSVFGAPAVPLRVR